MATTEDKISEQLGTILRELGTLSTNQSELHVKIDEIRRTVNHIGNDQVSTRFDVDRAHRRINSLEHQMALVSEKPDVPNWRPDPREITGTHDFAIIKKEHDEMLAHRKAEEDRRRDSGLWWKRQRWVWILTAVLGIFAASASACITYAVSHVK